MNSFTDQFTKILLGPLLLYQGKRTRATVPKLPEAAGPREFNPPSKAQTSLLIIGDSSAAGVGAESQSEALLGQLLSELELKEKARWKLAARSGVNTQDALALTEALPKERFDTVITVLGVNDVLSGVSLKSWLHEQETLRGLIKERFAPKQIIVCSLPPMGKFPALPQPLKWYLGTKADSFSQALERSVRGDTISSFSPIDLNLSAGAMATDGFHPGPEVYSAWARSLAALIS